MRSPRAVRRIQVVTLLGLLLSIVTCFTLGQSRSFSAVERDIRELFRLGR